MDKKQIAVLKRKATILKKRQLKEKKKLENETKRLLNAGFMFTNEKNNVSEWSYISLLTHTRNYIKVLAYARSSGRNCIGNWGDEFCFSSTIIFIENKRTEGNEEQSTDRIRNIRWNINDTGNSV